jgi:hypothetical protein
VPQLKLGRTPRRDEPKVTTPRWAQDRAVEIGHEIADWVSTSGVRVIGDLELLHQPLPAAGQETPHAPVVDPDAAAQALFGAVAATPTLAGAAPAAPALAATVASAKSETDAAASPVRQVRSTELVKILAGRARRRLARGFVHR